jgi:hypothetical protein
MTYAQRSLFEDSVRVLADIEAAEASLQDGAWCCFHFITDDDATNGRWGDDALAVQISRPLFEALPFDLTVDYHGGLVGIEAWEQAVPNVDWVSDRLPRMWDIATAAQMRFVGWTYETSEAIFQASP